MQRRWTVRLACRSARLCRADTPVIHSSAYRMHPKLKVCRRKHSCSAVCSVIIQANGMLAAQQRAGASQHVYGHQEGCRRRVIHATACQVATLAFQAALELLADLSGKREDVLRRRLALRPAALCCCLRSAAWEASAWARLELAEPMGEYAL